MREKIKNILKNKNVLNNLIIAFILIGLHIWQYIKSDYDVRPLVNLIMIVIFIIGTIIFMNRNLPIFLMVYAFVWLPFEEFDSLTSLLLFLSAVSLDKKLSVCFIPFGVATFMSYMLRGFEISHVGITACYLFFFWNIYKEIRISHSNYKELVLTEEEDKILFELCSGREVKELPYSEKTVYNKLTEARKRNNCMTNTELKNIYIQMKKPFTEKLQ